MPGGILKPVLWIRRAQHVSMRTKIAVPMVIMAVLPTVIVGTMLIVRVQDNLRSDLVGRLQFDTASKAEVVQRFLESVQKDILFMAQMEPIERLVNSAGDPNEETVIRRRQEAEHVFRTFFQEQRGFCQAQCLTAVGQPLIHLDINPDLIRVTPTNQLSELNGEFDLEAIADLRVGEIYVSPAHTDVVHGMKGTVIKYATPVLRGPQRDRVGGLLVVSVCARHVLSHVGTLPADAEAWVINAEGRYLGYVGRSAEKQGIYGLAAGRRLSDDFEPALVTMLLAPGTEGRAIEVDDAFVVSSVVQTSPNSDHGAWTLMIALPCALVDAPVHRMTVFLTVVVVIGAVGSGLLGASVALYLANPIIRLRQASRQIAEGDLTRRVQISTGDEIEALAADFNTMAHRLDEAQGRQAAWNEELAREVEAQTGKLRQLQAGLARVDKLASLGQMTAGVMHEIGNPLAAIKTIIQVAEEKGELDAPSRELYLRIVKQVDRLATFLRSFSRFTKLRPPRLELITLRPVIDEVASLIGPELKRSGLTLRVECSEDLPPIRGDTPQLQQLLINLILNAEEASAERGQIVVSARSAAGGLARGLTVEECVCLDVIDNGCGISPEIREHIWNPFFTTDPNGTGLGLAICRKIVHDHEGTIDVESEPGRGTTMRVLFPSARRDGRRPGAKSKSPDQAQEGSEWS